MANLKFYFIAALFIPIVQGCKIPASTTVADLHVPLQFGATDAAGKSAAILTRIEFFSDPYLKTLVDSALKRNLDLKTALQRIEMSRAQVTAARGALLPSLSLATSAGSRKFGEYTMDGIGNFDTNFSNNIGDDKHLAERLPDYYLGLQSAWEIDVWGKLRNNKKAALARLLASEQGKHAVTTSLVAEVAHFYYELITLDNELEIIRQNIILQETAVELINAQKAAGRANQLGVKQVTAQLLNTKSLEAQVSQEIIHQENQLNVLLGDFPKKIDRGAPILQQPLPEETSTGIPSEMLALRPDIREAELLLVAAKANVSAARAAFLPSLTITSAAGFQSFTPSVLFNTPGSIAYSIFGGLTAPVFKNGVLKANHRQASADQLQTVYYYQKTVLTGFSEVVTNMRKIENLKTVSALQEEEVKALQEAVSASKDLFIAGMATYLEVVTAQKNVLEAELNLSVTRKHQFYAVIDLYRALGGGWK